MKKDNLQRIVVVGIFILLALLIFNLFNVFTLKPQLEGKLVEIKELSRPANLELTVIKTTNCINCFDIEAIIGKIKKADVNITKELSLNTALLEDNEKIKEIINKYGIEKTPTIILKGEINKTSIQGFEEKRDALIFTGITPPYVNANTKEIIGKVKTIVITDENCDVCNDFGTFIQNLQQSGIVFSDINYFDYKNEEAKEFINNFNIETIPVLFLSEDIDVYSVGQQLSQQLEKEKRYYFIESPAPYTEVDTGKTRGLVNLIMITNNSCQECYDVSVNKQILAGLGVVIDEENTLDITSSKGKQLIERYDIEKVPMILLSPEAEVYDSFVQAWNQVGSVEKDGWFVMRTPEVVGVVKDLTTGKLIDLRSQSP